MPRQPTCLAVALGSILALAAMAPACADEPTAPQAAPPAQAPGTAQNPPAQPPAPQPAPPPLHERIDALLESTAAGPIAPLANDADFLRRVYLDLAGTIPDAATARAFLDDAAPSKRQALIDRLLAAPQFARHMQRVFDVMWMERRADANIPAAEWQEYLRKSFRDGKPLDQLAREILSADGADPALRPAARFYLDRTADPNLLTRDVGRLFFGRDLQCAQCHDHPLVDDYHQSEYYGLQAFVSRGTLFTDAKEKKSYYAELAEGEVNYKSVFTGDARERVLPELPQGMPVSEPMLAKADQYVVAPDKEVRPVPKYSRRAQLATLATCGTSTAFNRNLANRLWAQLMGRGLVHPLDMQHSANPAVQSQLLALLADELVRMKFDVKPFFREVALSRAYQRTSETPQPAQAKLDAAALAESLTAWKAEAQRLTDELPKRQEAATQSAAALDEAYHKYSAAAAARETADKAHAEAKKASDEVSAALAAAIKDVGVKEDVLKTLIAARVAADEAVKKLPGDKPLADAAASFLARSNEVDTARANLRKTIAEKTPQVQAASLKLAEADKALATATGEVAATRTALDAADAKAQTAGNELLAAKSSAAELTARVTDAEHAASYLNLASARDTAASAAQTAGEQLAALRSQTAATAEQVSQLAEAENATKTAQEKVAETRAAAEQGWSSLVDRATVRFTLGSLKPLSPEQLGLASMQALGLVDGQRVALEPQAKKDAEAAANIAPEARPQETERLLEERIDEKLRGNLGQFVSLFGQQPGQSATFQATVHQALFLSNGGALAAWLKPGGNNLTERLTKLEDPAALADELYLTVLTRRPTPEEQKAIADYWMTASADRAAAAQELVWSLITSAEFRFNR